MFIMVFNIEDKDKLIVQGQKFICEQKVGNDIAYLFNCNRVNLEEQNIKYVRTNKINFEGR